MCRRTVMAEEWWESVVIVKGSKLSIPWRFWWKPWKLYQYCLNLEQLHRQSNFVSVVLMRPQQTAYRRWYCKWLLINVSMFLCSWIQPREIIFFMKTVMAVFYFDRFLKLYIRTKVCCIIARKVTRHLPAPTISKSYIHALLFKDFYLQIAATSVKG
jgi:hypothetical protein